MASDDQTLTLGGDSEAVVRRFFELMDAQRVEELSSVLAPDLQYHLGSVTMTRDEFIAEVGVVFRAFPDFTHHVDDIVAVGSRVAARATDRATHRGEFEGVAPTGRTVTLGQIAFYELRDGKIIEVWEQADLAGLMAQLTAP